MLWRLLDDLKKSDYPYKRLIIVGSITVAGNTNTLAGNVPPKANVGDLITFASFYLGCIATTGLLLGSTFRCSGFFSRRFGNMFRKKKPGADLHRSIKT
ncbi:hypothetical protein V6N12_036183 [Hibiscus sabdariffa]|uniref:Uncharacterized protein n=1 Tax=Hibiscus sabdariffa TaxID=183260 RepID=A0ABR2EPV5_9ROSI